MTTPLRAVKYYFNMKRITYLVLVQLQGVVTTLFLSKLNPLLESPYSILSGTCGTVGVSTHRYSRHCGVSTHRYSRHCGSLYSSILATL